MNIVVKNISECFQNRDNQACLCRCCTLGRCFFNTLIFPRRFVLPSEMDPVSMYCVFPLLPPCALLLPQDASTSLGLKIDISPRCSLSLTLFSWGKWKAHILEGPREKTITFKIQWQISFCLCKWNSTRGSKGPNKKAFLLRFRPVWLSVLHRDHSLGFNLISLWFWSQISPCQLLHRTEAYLLLLTNQIQVWESSQYPNEKPILLNIWTGVFMAG